MKRSDIIRSIQVKFKRLSVQDAGAIMDNVADSLTDAMADGNRVEIRGFGTFMVRQHAPKTTINPRSGKNMTLPGRRAVLFRPSKDLVGKMN